MQNYCSIFIKCIYYLIFPAVFCTVIYNSCRGEQLCCKVCGLVLCAVASIRKRQCVQGATLERWYGAAIKPLICRNTTELKKHLSAGPLLFLRREHRSYSRERTDILSQRVKASISCDKHSTAWGKGNEIMYVCGTLSSRVIKMHLYISIFCSNWRTL